MHCVCIHMWVQVPVEPETSDPTGAGVPGGCELPYIGPVNHTCVPCTAVHTLNHWTIISNPILCNSDFAVLLVLVSIFIYFKNIFTSLLVFLLTQWLIKSMLSNSHVFIHFIHFLLLIFIWSPLWPETICVIVSEFCCCFAAFVILFLSIVTSFVA